MHSAFGGTGFKMGPVILPKNDAFALTRVLILTHDLLANGVKRHWHRVRHMLEYGTRSSILFSF